MTAKKLCLAILGPTASGKTAFAIEVAREIGGEIVCVDSTTVYRGFDIGTSKPTPEQQALVPHHLLDILAPEQPFNAHDFVAQARAVIQQIQAKGKIPLLVGGSYFYLRALQQGMYATGGYDDAALDALTEEFSTEAGLDGSKIHAALSALDASGAQALHPNDTYRTLRALALARRGLKPSELQPSEGMGADWIWLKYAMAISRKRLAENIAQRTQAMARDGLADEVRALLQSAPGAKALGSIGYAETVRYLKDEINEVAWLTQISDNTRQLLKRQMTWLRSDPELRYVDPGDTARVVLEVNNLKSVLGIS